MACAVVLGNTRVDTSAGLSVFKDVFFPVRWQPSVSLNMCVCVIDCSFLLQQLEPPLRGHGVAQHQRNERKNCNFPVLYPLTPYLQVLAREINCNVSGGNFLIYSFTKWFLFKII